MKLSQQRNDYARLQRGQGNPPGLQVCRELAREYLALEDETWISQACTRSQHTKCVMREECHCKVKACPCSPKEEAE